MPEFTYAGQVPVSYAEQRDSDGLIVGGVEHGDTRQFGDPDAEKPEGAADWWPAPDSRWVPAGTEIAAAWPGVSGGMYRDQAPAEDGTEDAEPAAEQDTAAHEPPPAPAVPDEPPAANPAGTGQEDEG